MVTLLRRFSVIAALMFWQGGFTFYAAVVVPIGQHTLGHFEQGFLITRHVTNYLNLAGGAALLLLAWDMAETADVSRFRSWARWLTWAGMVGTSSPSRTIARPGRARVHRPSGISRSAPLVFMVEHASVGLWRGLCSCHASGMESRGLEIAKRMKKSRCLVSSASPSHRRFHSAGLGKIISPLRSTSTGFH